MTKTMQTVVGETGASTTRQLGKLDCALLSASWWRAGAHASGFDPRRTNHAQQSHMGTGQSKCNYRVLICFIR